MLRPPPRRRISLPQPPKSQNLSWAEGRVTREDRRALLGHAAATLWFTGMSGSGKSTLAHALEHELLRRGVSAYVLDGDRLRQGLNANLGFSREDRSENIRRVGEVAKLFTDAGQLVLAAFISPYRVDRAAVREIFDPGDFIEVFVDCPLETCEERDVKGLYRRARAGEVSEFTGVSAPYEPPERPEIVVRTHENALESCVDQLLDELVDRGIIEGSRGRAPGALTRR